MTAFPCFARATLLAAIALAPLCATQGYAADRGGHDYVIDSTRVSPRTGVLRECIRTGMPEAGAPAEDCDGSTRSATTEPAPAPAAPPAPPPAAAVPAPEPEPPVAVDEPVSPELAPAVAVEEPVSPEPAPAVAVEEPRSPEPAPLAQDEDGMQADTELEPAPPAAEPAPSLARVTLNADADFDFDKAELRASGRAKLDQLAAQLRTMEYGSVNVVGHADRIGSQQYNLHLSLLRAQAVKDYLVSQQIDRKRIETQGVGASQPVTQPRDCEGMKKKALINCLQPDRRVEVGAEGTKVMRN
jgi:OOP family OmpA-OmpF porin